ncbi:MAG: hypothetical protein A2Z97_05560 [Bdellovibrionales bacterium GWB1_52_6]|nr:MAG: hypothetical protein A2Z97_05560 [Bdellovibrionales bacterium GWB1_52_6]
MGSITGTAAFAGFTFGPVINELAPSGPRSSVAITVRNPTDQKVPVMLYIVHREPKPDGSEEYKETPEIDDLFQIYPSQLILNANDLRTVRVSWIGQPKVTSELSFRLIAEELPFSMEPESSDMRTRAKILIATKYVGSVYITPPEAKPELQIIAKMADPEFKDQQGKIQLEITNTGTKHVIPRKLVLKIAGASGAPIELRADEFKKLAGDNVLAGKMRRHFLTAPAQLPPGPYKVTFELPEEK